MLRFSRRDFLKGALGLGVGLGLGAVGVATVRENLGQVAETAAATADLPFYARPARFAITVEGNTRCGDCHTDAPVSRTAFCHTEHRGSYVKCRLCPKGCLISEGHRGDCGVRENRGGVLYTMTYGNPCAVNVDPIEKKPFYHFLPSTLAFSLATAGCNLHCLYCQNWQISQVPPEETDFIPMLPQEVVGYALQAGCASIAYTYSEPIIFYEYMFDTAQAGRAQGVRSVVVSAGYINAEPLQELCAVVDAIKIDLKGIDEQFYEEVCFATLGPVLEAIRTIARSGTHLEVVNLVVPSMNDDLADMRRLARWLYQEIGPDVPLHFSRFHPQYRLRNLPPTPLQSLEQARAVALEEGLRFVYIGNVPGHEANHTYCPECGEIVIRRSGFNVVEMQLQDGRCPCGESIPGVWE